VWAADFCAEGSSPWVGNCMDVLSAGCPWEAFVADFVPDRSQHQTQVDSGELGEVSPPVDAGIEQKMVLRELLFLGVCIPN